MSELLISLMIDDAVGTFGYAPGILVMGVRATTILAVCLLLGWLFESYRPSLPEYFRRHAYGGVLFIALAMLWTAVTQYSDSTREAAHARSEAREEWYDQAW